MKIFRCWKALIFLLLLRACVNIWVKYKSVVRSREVMPLEVTWLIQRKISFEQSLHLKLWEDPESLFYESKYRISFSVLRFCDQSCNFCRQCEEIILEMWPWAKTFPLTLLFRSLAVVSRKTQVTKRKAASNLKPEGKPAWI